MIHWLASLPWLLVACMVLPIACLGLFSKTYPTPRWAWPFAAFFLLSFGVLLHPLAWIPLVFFEVLLGLVVTVDYFLLAGASHLRMERSMQRAASIAAPHPIKLTLWNNSSISIQFDLVDDIVDGLSTFREFESMDLGPRACKEIQYWITPLRRGAFHLEKVYIRFQSRLGFWSKYCSYSCPGTLHVYPDMKQLAEYAILARTNRLSLIGVRQTRKLGQDNNFERLRDYTVDDNYKHIDWRSTARRQKLTVKQFQSDQSQRIIFMLDCGRMMSNESHNLSLLDHAFNSILMLSYVALHQGDSVGLLCFSDTIHEFVPLRSGPSQMNRLLHAGFNRFPNMVHSRFDDAFLYLSKHCRRRSLVVLVTNVIDEVTSNQITSYLANLSGKHLPLLALLRDHRIFDFADNPSNDDQVLYRSAAAAQILNWRQEVMFKLHNAGVLVVDAFPEQLTSPLVNQYLEVKAKHIL